MGRFFVCPKTGLKRGAWTPEEDSLLSNYIKRYGHWNWRELPKYAGLSRCGKSCRLRWLNYLRPNIRRGNYTKEEEELIITLHKKLGNRWSAIAACLPRRTDNEIKNYWHTHIEKRRTRSTKAKPKTEQCEILRYSSLDDSCSPEEELKAVKCDTQEDSSLGDSCLSYSYNVITLGSSANPQASPENSNEISSLTTTDSHNIFNLQSPADLQISPGSSCDMSSLTTDSDYEAKNIENLAITDETEISSDAVPEFYHNFWTEPFLQEVTAPVIPFLPFRESLDGYDICNDYDMDLFFSHILQGLACCL